VTTRERVTVRSALSDLIQLVSAAAGGGSVAGDAAGAAEGAGAEEAFWDFPEQAIPAARVTDTTACWTTRGIDFLT